MSRPPRSESKRIRSPYLGDRDKRERNPLMHFNCSAKIMMEQMRSLSIREIEEEDIPMRKTIGRDDFD